ncbi:uncharacterized protein LOC117190188 [Drosophila miranda]|uniref:uncharacterized protein LOC117190188 n=1 Tax=Drosophila miranda TaxID=7229 RepID=UPI00143F242B|nr:uncharacterized protein LOC117190188 [Drosophila miranda]
MATSVIRSSVVSTSAGRRNICDCLAKESSGLRTLPLKSQSYSHLGGCACLRCHYLAKKVIVTSTSNSSDDTLPVEHKHHPLSAISLGTLSTKESLIFVRRQHLILPQEEQQPPAPVISSPHSRCAVRHPRTSSASRRSISAPSRRLLSHRTCPRPHEPAWTSAETTATCTTE